MKRRKLDMNNTVTSTARRRAYTVTVTNPEGEVILTTAATIYVERSGKLYSYNTQGDGAFTTDRVGWGYALGKDIFESFGPDVASLDEDWARGGDA